MSIMRCDRHDRRWDSDTEEGCMPCLIEEVDGFHMMRRTPAVIEQTMRANNMIHQQRMAYENLPWNARLIIAIVRISRDLAPGLVTTYLALTLAVIGLAMYWTPAIVRFLTDTGFP